MSRLLERVSHALEDRYEVLDELGRGGMSMVFQARDIKHDRTVALKVLLPELAASVGAQRFLREIEIAASLVHPHILPLYDSGEADGLLFHVTPVVEGETLRDRLRRERYLPVEQAVGITAEIADALDFAHARGVIHRDIKPENVLLTRRHALLTDFGIARAITLGGGERLTETGMAVGTPAYMSPEQARGEDVLDGRSDIYSLACVTYEMLAGEAPLAGRSPQITMARRQSEAPPSLTLLRETVPEALDAVVLKALSRLPVDRFAQAAQFGDAVRMASGAGTGGYSSVSTPGVPVPVDGTGDHGVAAGSRSGSIGKLSFWEELKRRKVYNVGLVYLAFLAAAADLVSNTFPDFQLDSWIKPVKIALILGFPLALGLAWTFELNREGVRRTGTFEATSVKVRRWPLISRGAVAAAVVILAAWLLWFLSR
ncbi:MAG: serine/threonine-protein kinase [Candidatus Palauibacterales bacterium]|jgi:Protein kinase domain|nr:serine/threonine-protein kinase [Candidatus Palauibacterales bacterium]MDP2483040.1 serine/threonine-protein kinase [Candidatus Palauibacterales bacterium]